MRVLLVDDDTALREMCTDLLRDMDFEVDAAPNAEDALEKVAVHRYDVILSDIQMPGMSGMELLKAVRRVDLDVPVILMTGVPSMESAIQAVEYGAFRYLPKPMTAAQLEDTIRRAARYHALARLTRDAIGLSGGSAHWPADPAALEARFESALAKLWMAFQPIVACGQRTIHAYEALLRSDEESLRSPGDIIQAAEQLGRLEELGRTIRTAVAGRVSALPSGTLVFVNLHPAELNDARLYGPRNALLDVSSRVVYEITERAALHDVADLQTKLENLRSKGFRLAVDDLGAGYAGLTSMAQLEPEYVKLDMSLIRGIHARPTQQKLVRSMVNLCAELGKIVIAEGVEEAAERDALVEIGCDLLQGYLFAKPQREPPNVIWP